MADEATLEWVVQDAMKVAMENAKAVFFRPPTDPNGKGRTLSDRIGIYVTCLRTALIAREDKIPSELRVEYELTKNNLCKTANWSDVGVFAPAQFGFQQSDSGRWKRTRVFDVGQPGTGRSFAAEAFIKGNNMDKDRIAQLATQAKEETDGFDFNASFKSMEQTIRDMNVMVKRHESLSGQATQVTESLCAVAESLTL